MNISEKGRKKLYSSEAKVNTVYKDSAGLPTIGIGHLLTRSELMSGKIRINGEMVKYSSGLTDQQCYDLFDQDLVRFEKAIELNINVPLNQDQFDALVHFCYNIGAGAFAGSTLVKLLNQGKYNEVPNQMRRWRMADGKVSKGLVNRREVEVKMWNGEE